MAKPSPYLLPGKGFFFQGRAYPLRDTATYLRRTTSLLAAWKVPEDRRTR